MKMKKEDFVRKAAEKMLEKCLKRTKVEILLGFINDADMIDEFTIFSMEKQISDDLELCEEFCKQYPDKFRIIPENERYQESKWFISSSLPS